MNKSFFAVTVPLLFFLTVRSQPIPNDSSLITGKLVNGIAYYIRKNANPAGKVFMKLVVKAGSAYEDPDQYELAHLLEHLAFNETDHFKNSWAWLESTGAVMGRNANAATGMDETVYWFNLDARPAVIDSGILLLSDIVQGIHLDSSIIDDERGVVLGEIREASGYIQRLSEQYRPDVLYYVRNGNVPVSARIKNLKDFKRSSLQRFYSDWYRPDRMAVIIVGDVDAADMEKIVKEKFEHIPPATGPLRKINYLRPFSNTNRYIIATDREMPETSVSMYFNKIPVAIKTQLDLKNELITQLWEQVAKNRFDNCRNQYNLPFQTVTINRHRAVFPCVETMSVNIFPDKEKYKECFQLMFTELERIKRYGITVQELEDAKLHLKKRLNRPVTSELINSRCQQHFTDGSAIPDEVYENKLAEDQLRKITTIEINKYCAQQDWNNNRDIVVLAPDKEKPALPSRQDVERWYKEISGRKKLPPQPGAIAVSWADVPRLKYTKVEIVADSFYKEIDTRKLLLHNGAKVVLHNMKTAARDPGRILLHAFAAGRYDDENYFDAAYAAEVIDNAGAGQWDKFRLHSLKEKAEIELSPYIYDASRGFRGSVATSNIEKLFRLFNLIITQPRKDAEALEDWRNQKRQQLNYQQWDASQSFNEMVDSMINVPLLYRRKITLGDIQRINMDTVLFCFKEAFRDWSNFTFVLSGDIDSIAVGYIINYIGSLPSGEKSTEIKNDDTRIPGATRKILTNGTIADKARVQLVSFGIVRYDNENMLKVSMAKLALKHILLNRLREKEGATYSVKSTITSPTPGDSICRMLIGFDCSANRVDKAIDAVKEELMRLKTVGIADSIFQQCKNAWMHEYDINRANNNWWLNYLSEQSKTEADILSYYKQRSLLFSLTNKEMQQFFASFFFNAQLLDFIQLTGEDH